MIITKDIKPESQLYAVGAIIISVINELPTRKIEAFELYEIITQQTSVSLNTFFLGIDWLYLLGILEDSNGAIVKCS